MHGFRPPVATTPPRQRLAVPSPRRVLPIVVFSVLASVGVLAALAWLIPAIEASTLYWCITVGVAMTVSTPAAMYLMAQVERTERLTIELRNAYETMKAMAETDHLTGVLNRAAFTAAVKAGDPRASGWVVMIDVDHFKRINDVHGHGVGDRTLSETARAIAHAVRMTDIVGRWGGEEFAAYLPGADCDGAMMVAERMRSSVEEIAIQENGQPLRVTISVGIASIETPAGVHEAMRQADVALYRAKSAGRNRVIQFA